MCDNHALGIALCIQCMLSDVRKGTIFHGYSVYNNLCMRSTCVVPYVGWLSPVRWFAALLPLCTGCVRVATVCVWSSTHGLLCTHSTDVVIIINFTPTGIKMQAMQNYIKYLVFFPGSPPFILYVTLYIRTWVLCSHSSTIILWCSNGLYCHRLAPRARSGDIIADNLCFCGFASVQLQSPNHSLQEPDIKHITFKNDVCAVRICVTVHYLEV